MGSSTIEREIVQMQFDAKEFQKGVQASLKELEDFKKSFNFNNANQSLAELDKSAQIDFHVMAEGIASINSKMSLMGVTAAAIIANIATSVLDAGKKLADTLILEPLRGGLGEYETQMGAIQTILANTAKYGTTLDDVNAALNELNNYADLTIYNFTQMVDSIGKFTTAGVDLDTSTSAIKGIANVAALSGSNAEQAATAMYQLSQAISSGVVRLQDWISVENAGMGGALFKDALVETARLYDDHIDHLIEKNGGFRTSLKEGWLTSEILLATLQKFTGDLSDEQLKEIGYTEEQIVEIQKLAQTALDAATDIKTLTALKDTLGEVLGSGWAQTWTLIFGDFEEAKALWGSLGDLFSGMIESSSKARNDLLEGWRFFGGRTIAIEGFFNLIEAGQNVLTAFGEAVTDIFKPLTSIDLLRITIIFRDFTEKLKIGSGHLKTFKDIVRGAAAALDIVRLAVQAVLGPLIDRLLPGLDEGSTSFLQWLSRVGNAITAFREFAIETGFFDEVVANVAAKIKEFAQDTKELVQSFFELEIVQKVIKWFRDLERSDFVKVWDGFLTVVRAIIAPFYLMALAVKEVYEEIIKLERVQKILQWFRDLKWTDIQEAFQSLRDSISGMVEKAKQSDIVGKLLAYFDTFDGRRIKQFFGDAKEGFSWMPALIDKAKGALNRLKPVAATVGEALKGVAEAIINGLGQVLDYLTENAGNLDYSKLFDLINTGLLAGLVLSIRKLGNSLNIGDALEGVFGEDSSIGGAISETFQTLQGTLSAFQTNVKADALKKIAVSIALLAGSIILLTFIDSEKLQTATIAVVAMLAALFGATGALSLIKTSDATKGALAIVGLSVALTIASLALQNVASLDPDELSNGLEAMGLGLVALIASVKGLGGGGAGLIKTSVGVIILGLALIVLSEAVKKFGEMEPDVLEDGLLGVGLAIGIIVAAIVTLQSVGTAGILKTAVAIVIMSGSLIVLGRAVDTFGNIKPDVLEQGLTTIAIILGGFAAFSQLIKPQGMLKAAVAITVMSGALLVMSLAMQSFASLEWEELGRGLAGMAGALALLVIAANLMSGALAGAAATLVMSVAILALAGALKILSTLTWEELLISLAAIAGVFIILGVAGYLLAPAVPVLLGIGAALLLIGAGAALFGAGIFLAATGLVLLAGSAALVAGGITLIGGAIIQLLPKLGAAIAEAVVNFLVVLAENTPKIVEAMQTIILGMIGGISELIPEVVVVILDLITAILEAIGEALPDLIQAGFDILLAFLQGISDNIQDVVVAAGEVVTEFIDGIAEVLPDIIDSAFNLLLTFLQGIDDAVEEYTDDIVATGLSIAGHLITGIVTGVWDGLGSVIDAVKGLAGQALAALTGKDGFDEGSPSKKTYKVARNVVSGFINGIDDGTKSVRKSLTNLAKEAEAGINPLVDLLTQDVASSMEFSPVISPVLDLDNISSGVISLNKSFNNSRVLAELSYEGTLVTPEETVETGVNGSRNGITFIQHNYSPKALDREAIYRQTRTQVARLSERAFE